MIHDTTTYIWPGKTVVGFGALAKLGKEIKTLGGTAVFLTSDPGLEQAGVLSKVTSALQSAALPTTTYTAIPGNPDVASVDAAGAAFHESGADIIVALGGGSVIDASKGVRVLAGSPQGISIAKYSLRLAKNRRPLPSISQMPAMIALPTTSGTGAEATPWGLLTDLENKVKFAIGDTDSVPTLSLLDPSLTISLPPHLTAATGMDALSHLIEAYVSINEAPAMLDPLILDGISKIGRFLPLAVSNPNHRQARYEMIQASYLGGVAITSRWLGTCHALAHPLSALANVHHGVACGLMLPYQMAFSLPGALERYANVALALDKDVADLPRREQAEEAVALVRQLQDDINLPTALRNVGVTEDLLKPLAKAAINDLNHTTNPRVTSEADMLSMYQAAF